MSSLNPIAPTNAYIAQVGSALPFVSFIDAHDRLGWHRNADEVRPNGISASRRYERRGLFASNVLRRGVACFRDELDASKAVGTPSVSDAGFHSSAAPRDSDPEFCDE